MVGGEAVGSGLGFAELSTSQTSAKGETEDRGLRSENGGDEPSFLETASLKPAILRRNLTRQLYNCMF